MPKLQYKLNQNLNSASTYDSRNGYEWGLSWNSNSYCMSYFTIEEKNFTSEEKQWI